MKDNKVFWIIILVTGVLAALSAVFALHRGSNIQQVLADTRKSLRQQGFKTDLSDFNFSTDAATRTRENALTFAGGYVLPDLLVVSINLRPVVGDDAVVVVGKQSYLETGSDIVHWPDLRDALETIRPQLDEACDAAISGPIEFNLDASRGSGLLLRHLAPLRALASALGSREVLELHDGHRREAWTNLLAATRLATAWEPEPADISHIVRFALTSFAFNDTWQALQCEPWPDEELAPLQHEWESVNFFTNLPETIAFRRASTVALCQETDHLRSAKPVASAAFFHDLIHSPASAFAGLKREWDDSLYRRYGMFDDEKNLLLYFQSREVEYRQAVESPTWMQMRALPGATNSAPFKSTYSSRLQIMLNLQLLHARTLTMGGSLLARAATAEAQRRILITVIALERYRGKHGSYPATLTALAPEFLKSVPVDFMDGQPLRYRLANDGHFVLYSVGLDCVDNGGKISANGGRGVGGGSPEIFSSPTDADIVWPRPASATDAGNQQQQELDTRTKKLAEMENLQAAAQWEHTARHQADADILLSAPAITNLAGATFHNQPLGEIIRNPESTGTNELSLAKILTLKQIITGREPETVTFDLPVAYDLITNLGELHLYIDPTNNDNSDVGCNVQQMECDRAANGDCLLVWNTIYESPGIHALQAGLTLNELPPDKQDFDGPLLEFTTTNLCQFSLGSSTYDVDSGALFHARLPEADGTFTIECLTTNGAPLKTITGSTSNGEINVRWNLVDDHGHRLAGETFNSLVHVSLPDSGRKQTLRGP